MMTTFPVTGGTSVESGKLVLCLLLCSMLFTNLWLVTAVLHLYELGKSKTRIRKESEIIPFCKKLLLIGFLEKCQYHSKLAKRLCYVYWINLICTFVCIALSVLSIITSNHEIVFGVCGLVKIILLDVPINLYAFIMTKHDKKHGGVTWRWTKED